MPFLGGSGTLGRALLSELIKIESEVARVVIFSRDEIKQLEMMDTFPEDKYPFLEYKLGDVRDLERLTEILKEMDYVVHAAALKHVVMAEKNPEECRKTNVGGTKNVIQACDKNGVEKAILVSTDKAFRPIGVYGKSKAEAEQLFANAGTNSTTYGIVRLGNIIGARGSVFEAFERQKKTGTLSVTHPEATRFCISQESAAQFILEAFETDLKAILVPQMEVFSVIELAKKIAPDCNIEIVGLRAGDKLHEELENISSSKLLLEP